MKNRDNHNQAIQTATDNFRATFTEAVTAGNDEAMSQAIADYAIAVQSAIVEDARNGMVLQANDNAVLAARGVRVLTSEETAYYTQLATAMESSRPAQALTGGELTIPRTIVDATLDDIATAFPLLHAIDFRNTTGVTKILINAADVATATWGKLGSAVTAELEAAFEELDCTACKLTAYLPVSKDFLRLAKSNLSILDNYVRAILSEAYGMGAEAAVVNGTGKDQPIGMLKDTGPEASVLSGVYPDRKAVKVTSLDPEAYGKALAPIAMTPGKRPRAVRNLIMVCNPADYLTKVMPATTVMAADGSYRNDVLPIPTKVFQSVACPSGKAVVGLAHRYVLAAGLPNGIEYSDEVNFIEDQRVYLGRFLGNGRPKDSTAFVTLDISTLTPAAKAVTVKGTVNTKTQA